MLGFLGRTSSNSNSGSFYARLPHQDNWGVSRRERIRNIACNPRITDSLPLAPRVLSNGTEEFDPTIVVLSYDGFRTEYLTRGLTPNILSVGKVFSSWGLYLVKALAVRSYSFVPFDLIRMYDTVPLSIVRSEWRPDRIHASFVPYVDVPESLHPHHWSIPFESWDCCQYVL